MSFEVQARLIERRVGVVVRDETRWATATDLDRAVTEARRHVADGFTVWIFLVEPGSHGHPTYIRVDTLRPGVGSPRLSDHVLGRDRRAPVVR